MDIMAYNIVFVLCFAIVVEGKLFSGADDIDGTCSKFPCEEHMLEKLIRMEAKMDNMYKEMKSTIENSLAVLRHRREEMERF